MTVDRRAFIAAGVAASFVPAAGRAQDAVAPSADQRRQMADAVAGFMKAYDVPGLGIAFARDGRVVYDEAFGLADRETRTALTPAHRFRIASISKPITSVAIFRLIEAGKLALDARVLGPGGVLGEEYGAVPADSPLRDITVNHLLTHTAGGWSNDKSDPMGRFHELDHAGLIAWTLKNRPLATAPGAAFAYSNFGYCLLGRVVEKKTQSPYAAHVKEAVLAPAGIADMEIAGNTLAERRPDEVRYYGQGKDNPYAINVRRMDSHGGWIARPSALVRFAGAIDGPAPSALLTPGSVAAMSAPSSDRGRYAKGWRVSPSGNWWHGGHLSGTAGLLVRTKSRLCWAALLNTRHRDDDLDRDLDRLLWKMARAVPAWRV